MPTSEQDLLLQRLRDTESALRRQLAAIDRLAERTGTPSELLCNPDGSPIAAPVLIALANVQVALLQQQTLLGGVARSCTGCVPGATPRFDCPVHGHG